MMQTPWLPFPARQRLWARLALPTCLLLACWLSTDVFPTEPVGHAANADAVAANEEAAGDSGEVTAASPAEGQRAQHLKDLGADRWHASGHRGRGVKVAILDSGFRGYRDHLGKALPAQVTARSFRKDGNLEARDSQHGILCGEVVHALVPEAQLLFANWEPDSPEQFLKAVGWARDQGARVLSCSVIMPCWSDGEGGGPVHEALARVVGSGAAPGDLLCIACAGNTAQRHWNGSFRAGQDGFHEWNPGQRDNALTPWGDERVSVELCWQSDADYELSIHEQATGSEVGRSSTQDRPLRSSAVVRLQPQAGCKYQVRVRLSRGPAGPFHLVALGAGLECATARGSIPFPADGPAFLAVGAVNQLGERAGYSSCGPNSDQPKPDFVAPVPFPSAWRSRPFAGTSAAAPQAAGLAALWCSRHPDWSAAQVRGALRAAARDLGPAGHDCETGYGLVQLP